MAVPDLPTNEELQNLLADLTAVVQSYSTAPDLNGYMSRVQIIEKAKKMTRELISPDQLPNYHGLNVRFVHLQKGHFTDNFYSDGRARRYPNIHKAQGPGSYSRDWVNLTPRSIEGDWGSGFPVRYGPHATRRAKRVSQLTKYAERMGRVLGKVLLLHIKITRKDS